MRLLDRAFQPARAALSRWLVFKVLVQTAVFWTVFLLLGPRAIVAVDRVVGVPALPQVPAWIGWTLFCTAGGVGITSGLIMALAGRGTPLPLDCPTQLVIVGPYAYTRNPMAITGLAQGFAVGMLLESWSVLTYTLAGGVLWHTLVRPVEERDLSRRFGQSFEAYRREVPCWLIRFRRYQPAGRSGRKTNN